jgi:hypothetical protein
MEKIALYMQHNTNPLHVYCLLVRAGLNKALSMSLARGYEKYVFSWFKFLTLLGIASSRKRLFRQLLFNRYI